MTAIIILPNLSRASRGNKVRDFYWSDEHGQYIWQGRELSVAEFNEKIGTVTSQTMTWHPYPVISKIIEPIPDILPLPPIVKKRRNMAKARAAQTD